MKTRSLYRSPSMHRLSLSAMAWACAPMVAPGGTASADAAAVSQRERAAGNDRKACVTRAQGQGSTSASVAGGGILREKVSVVPAPK